MLVWMFRSFFTGSAARFYKVVHRAADTDGERSRFLADVSHEFKTPVAVLICNMEVLEGKRGGSRKDALAVMSVTLTRMSRMVDHLLASARLDFSQGELCREEIAVAELLQGAYGDCLLLMEAKGVALSHTSDDSRVFGDKDKLREVILNLISNALKHTPRGGAIALIGEARGAEVQISVCDTGSGIAPKELPHIFERFYRIKGDGSPGTGLGLDICRKIALAHGGTITAESEPHKGSRFTVSLKWILGSSPPALARMARATSSRIAACWARRTSGPVHQSWSTRRAGRTW